jgi:phosphoglycerate dehydrogenase-like enzyme
MRIAILDDYQHVALASADWSRLGAEEVTPFHGHISDSGDLVAALRPYDVIVAMRERTPFDAERLRALPSLRLLVTTGMANASIDVETAQSLGVTVCGTRGSATSTAELTWALILSLVRHIPEENRRMRAGGWQESVGLGLHGRTLGIVGLGRQGKAVATIGLAFGMRVLAWSQHLGDSSGMDGVTAVSKQVLFTESDVVSVHYKLGPRSAGLVGAAELASMKPGAYLVNTSRGPIVDTGALLSALRSGTIAGAALDVYDEEPLPADHPLRSAPRTVLTPHLGYVTDDGFRTFYEDVVSDIEAFQAGSPARVISSLFLSIKLTLFPLGGLLGVSWNPRKEQSMAGIRPRDLLTGDLLERLAGHQVAMGVDARAAGLSPSVSRAPGLGSGDIGAILSRDIAKLRDVGYLKVALPQEFGGLGCTLRQAACGQRHLTYRSPLTALAVSAHLYWTGAAADAYRAGDTSVKWILLEAARGALFGGGHGLPGADLQFSAPQSRCTVTGESGYRFRNPSVLAGLTPGWDWVAVHAVTEAARPKAVLSFAGRGSRCTPTYRVARVLPPGTPDDIFTTSALGWGFSVIASVQYAIARSAFNNAVRAVSLHAMQSATAHPLDRWAVAEASLRLDAIKARIADVTHPWQGEGFDGQEFVRLFGMRHEVADGARRVLDLVAQITDTPADSAPAAVAR